MSILMNLLSNNGYIIVNKEVIKKIGLHEAIILGELCSEYCYWEKANKLDNGYFFSTRENIADNTGLSEYQQREPFKKLINMGIVKEKLKGMPQLKWYSLDMDNLYKLFNGEIDLKSRCEETKEQGNEKLEVKQSNNLIASQQEIGQLDVKKIDTNNNNNNNKNKNKKEDMKKFQDKVFMTETNYKKLIQKYGKDRVDKTIVRLDLYKKSTGKVYSDDYATLSLWIDEDIEKIKELHNYSVDLSNTLNEMAEELNNGTLKWSDLTSEATSSQISEVSTFDVVEENFHEYTGLIYDGAFSEHITSSEKKGLTGDEIDEESAKQIAENFIGKDKIKETKNNGYVENGDIPVYRFEMTTNEDKTIGISISKKGGHVVFLNYNRDVNEEKISEQDAVQKGKEYLANKGFNNMKETYYLKENGFITVNYAYQQDDVVIYPDLIKVKIALDDGEVIGLETTGYLNCHYTRNIPTNRISIDDARKKLSSKVEITSEGLAIIPTEWKTEKFCYEFKGKADDIDFIAYINAENGEEEDILIITNTPNGTLTE